MISASRFTLYKDFSFISANGAGPHTLSRATKYAKRSFSVDDSLNIPG